MATFHFELVSPDKVSFSGEVDQVDVPGSEGDFGVLVGHAPLIALIRPGVMKVTVAGETTSLNQAMVAKGFALDLEPSGKGRFAVEVVDLNALVRENLTLLRASLSRTVSVDLELDCDDCFVASSRRRSSSYGPAAATSLSASK